MLTPSNDVIQKEPRLSEDVGGYQARQVEALNEHPEERTQPAVLTDSLKYLTKNRLFDIKKNRNQVTHLD